MHVDSVKVAFPSRVVTNDEILELVRRHSVEASCTDLEQVLALTAKWLQHSGARTRRWLGEGETPIGLVDAAVKAALTDAGASVDDIELLMYVGVAKGFQEPGQAHLVAHALGMHRADCFDVVDACMSWTRGMHIAEAFLRTRRYRRILIVNSEINTFLGGPLYPANYRVQRLEELECTFPSYTIGGAATATLVSRDDDNPWTWRFVSRPDLAELCTLPIAPPELFANLSDKIGKNGVHRFTSFGKEMHQAGGTTAIELMRVVLAEHPAIARIFPHTSSYREWDGFARALGVADRMHHLYPDHGNLVSASVPSGMATAIEQGLLRRGDRAAGWMGSAGMSFAAYSFVY